MADKSLSYAAITPADEAAAGRLLAGDRAGDLQVFRMVAGIFASVVLIASFLIALDYLSAYLITGYWPH